jgi:monoamine oxidase
MSADGTLSAEDAGRLQAGLSNSLAAARENSLGASSTLDLALSDILFDASSSADSRSKDFARVLEVGYGVEVERVSLEWHNFSQPFGGSNASPEGGFQNLVGLVLEDAKSHGAQVELSTYVDHITSMDDGVELKSGDKTYKARTTIVTIPLGVLKHTAANLFHPALPARRTRVISRTHVGVLEKLVLSYPKAWWPNASTVGSFTFLPRSTSTVGEGDDAAKAKDILDSHTISAASFEAPALPRTHPTILFYISSSPATKLSHLSEAAVAQGAHTFLCERFGVTVDQAPQPQATARTTWASDPLSRGATSTPVVVGEGRSPLDFVELGKSLWDGKLGFAGEHTDLDHRGSVAGAVVSGSREAERVIKLLRAARS